MPNETYQFDTIDTPLETYEWDDIWWDNPADKTVARILIIGDSISCGYRRAATKIENRDVFIDGIATSKAVDNKTFYTLIDYFASNGLSYDAVFFNNGLHGWHLDDTENFGKYFEALAAYVKEKFAPKKLFIVLTTPVRKSRQTEIFDERNEHVKVRNQTISAAAKKLDAEIVDFYSPIEDRADLYTQDGVHLLPEAYASFANTVISKVK